MGKTTTDKIPLSKILPAYDGKNQRISSFYNKFVEAESTLGIYFLSLCLEAISSNFNDVLSYEKNYENYENFLKRELTEEMSDEDIELITYLRSATIENQKFMQLINRTCNEEKLQLINQDIFPNISQRLSISDLCNFSKSCHTFFTIAKQEIAKYAPNKLSDRCIISIIKFNENNFVIKTSFGEIFIIDKFFNKKYSFEFNASTYTKLVRLNSNQFVTSCLDKVILFTLSENSISTKEIFSNVETSGVTNLDYYDNFGHDCIVVGYVNEILDRKNVVLIDAKSGETISDSQPIRLERENYLVNKEGIFQKEAHGEAISQKGFFTSELNFYYSGSFDQGHFQLSFHHNENKFLFYMRGKAHKRGFVQIKVFKIHPIGSEQITSSEKYILFNHFKKKEIKNAWILDNKLFLAVEAIFERENADSYKQESSLVCYDIVVDEYNNLIFSFSSKILIKNDSITALEQDGDEFIVGFASGKIQCIDIQKFENKNQVGIDLNKN